MKLNTCNDVSSIIYYLVLVLFISSCKFINTTIIRVDLNRFFITNDFNNNNLKETNQNLIKLKENNLKPVSSLIKPTFNLTFSEFNFDKTYNNYTLFLGNTKNIWLLAKSSNNKIFYSADDGNNFKQFEKLDQIDNIFVNQFHTNNLVLSDAKNRKIYVSKDNGVSFQDKKLSFSSNEFYFNKDENVLICIENYLNNKNVHLSLDFGDTWIYLTKGLNSVPKWTASNYYNLYFIEDGSDKDYLYKLNLKNLKENPNKLSESKQLLISKDILDFKLFESYIFLVVKEENLISLLVQKISTKKPKWKTAIINFDSVKPEIKKFDVLWADEKEIYLSVTYEINNNLKTDIFITNDVNNLVFDLSLENLITNDNKANEFKSLNDYGGVFVANTKSINGKHKQTNFKNPTSDKWFNLIMEDKNLAAHYLDLTNNLYFSHEFSQSSFYDAKFPEFLIATAYKNETEPFVCISYHSGELWHQILSGSYLYSVGEYGHIIIVFEKYQSINELYYSENYGHEWYKKKFTNEPVIINDILKHPNELVNKFYLFATDPKTNLKKIIILEAHKIMTHLNDDHLSCEKRCRSQELLRDICLDESIICDGKVNCEESIDELNCKDKITTITTSTPATTSSIIIKDTIIELNDDYIKKLFNLSIKNLKMSKNSLEFNYFIDYKPVDGIKLNNYFVKLIKTKRNEFSFELKKKQNYKYETNKIDLDKLESDSIKINEFKLTDNKKIQIIDLNNDFQYFCIFYANISKQNELKNSLIIFDEYLKFETNKEDVVSRSQAQADDYVEQINILNFKSICLILLIIVTILVTSFILVKIKAIFDSNLKKKIKAKYSKVLDKAVVLKIDCPLHCSNSNIEINRSSSGLISTCDKQKLIVS